MDNGLLLNKAKAKKAEADFVLILIVMDNGLLPLHWRTSRRSEKVLILIVMDNGLLHKKEYKNVGASVVLILIVMDNGLLPI